MKAEFFSASSCLELCSTTLHPGRIKWHGYSVSEITGPLYLLSVELLSTLLYQ
ncbi:hypothetical protein T11_7937 [Trichinella zimbabwensis]|uniref:Uncharacterized protein n=1 Tax=Trichinella zimbabwensis TaxID=268475 RepID=A0A0V1G9A6_9BILA|nr:hypothetical protein T11_7937 [Trichinella zimbabwensis]